MPIATTWPFRRRQRVQRPSDLFAGAGRLGTPSGTVATPVEPDAPAGDVPTLDDYAGLPAEGQLGFERSSYTFTVEVGETEQPTPDGRILLGKVTARTAGYESPTAYYLEEVPIALDLEITPDGSIWWIRENYPVYSQALFPGTRERGLRDRYLLAGARLRDQRVRTNIIISPVPLVRRQLRDTIVLDANGTPITNSRQAGWRYVQPTPVPLPSLNFSSVLTAARFAWDAAFNIFRLTNPFTNNPNPFRTDDFTTLSVGGVQMTPGYIPLKDAFINRVADEFIIEYSATIEDGFNLGVTTKPYCPRISDFGNDDTRLSQVRTLYGHYVVWWPRHAHERDLQTTITVTATSVFGDKYTTTWSVSSININDEAVPITIGAGQEKDVNVPTSNTLKTGDLRMLLSFGIDQSEQFVIIDDEDYYRRFFSVAETQATSTQLFVNLVADELGVFDAAKGRALDLVVRGKLVAWQIAWATNTDSGSYYLWPGSSSLYQYAPGAALELITSSLGGARPPGSEKRGTIGTQTLSGVYQPDSVGNIAESLGPHLKIKAHSSGVFSFIASDTPGSTIVQIVPFVHEWYAWAIPIPYVGPLLSSLFSRIAGRYFSRALSTNILRNAGSHVLVFGGAKEAAKQLNKEISRNIYGALYRFAFRPAAQATQNVGINSALSISSSKAVVQSQNSSRLARSNRVTGTAGGFENLGFDGLVGPPVVGPVFWQGDYICGKFITLPAGSAVEESS